MDRLITSLSNLLSGSTGQRPVFRNGAWESAELPFVELETYSPSQSTDWTDAISAAVVAAQARGNGTIVVPSSAGTFDVDGVVRLPHGINISGQGSGKANAATTIRMTAADAQIRYEHEDGSTGGRGGMSGGFCVDANDIATDPVYIGRSTQRTFADIDVINAAAGGAATLVEYGQNDIFLSYHIEDCGGDGLVFDLGTGGHIGIGVEITGIGGTHVVYRQSGASSGLYTVPTNINFVGGVVERHTATTDQLLLCEQGLDINYFGTTFAYAGLTSAKTMIKMTSDGVLPSARLRLIGTPIQGDVTYATVFDLATSTSVILSGRPAIKQALNLYKLASGARVYIDSDPEITSVTNLLAAGSTGTIDSCVRHYLSVATQVSAPAAADTVSIQSISGETGARHRVNGLGTHEWGAGSTFTYDTNIARGGANLLTMGAGDAFRTGAIAALPAAAVGYRGYLYRVEGGAGVADAIYICEKDAAGAYAWRAL